MDNKELIEIVNRNEIGEIIRKSERYDILVNLLKNNIEKTSYGNYLRIKNDEAIIEFLKAIGEIKIPVMEETVKETTKEITEYPF